MVHFSSTPWLCQALSTFSLVSAHNVVQATSIEAPIAANETVQLSAGPSSFSFDRVSLRTWILAGLVGLGTGAGLLWLLNPRRREAQIKKSLNPLNIPSEAPLLERLHQAQRSGREVELFHRDNQEKYVGVIRDIKGAKWVQLSQAEHGVATIEIEGLLTIRGRDDDNLTHKFVHQNLGWTQLGDKSINKNGAYSVLVDFADPRLVAFLGQLMHPIRMQLYLKKLTQLEAAKQAWQLVKDYVPYDYAFRERLRTPDKPRELYRLGDFIDRGICNERGMLYQVSLQYLGIKSQWCAGKWGTGNHAWVEACPLDGQGQTHDVLFDPQNSRPLDRADPADHGKLAEYQRSSTDHKYIDPMLGTVQHDALSTTVIENLLAEGLELSQVAAMQQGAYQDWDAIQSGRRSEIDCRLRFSHLQEREEDKLSVSDLGRENVLDLPSNSYSIMTNAQQVAEKNVAIDLYNKMTREEKDFMFETEGEQLSLMLPEYYLQSYTQFRWQLHDSGRFPFGQTRGLQHAMSNAFRGRLARDGYVGPAIDPSAMQRWIAGRRVQIDQFSSQSNSLRQELTTLLAQQVEGFADLDPAVLTGLINFTEHHWRDAQRIYSGQLVLQINFIRVAIVAYNRKHPHLKIGLREVSIEGTLIL